MVRFPFFPFLPARSDPFRFAYSSLFQSVWYSLNIPWYDITRRSPVPLPRVPFPPTSTYAADSSALFPISHLSVSRLFLSVFLPDRDTKTRVRFEDCLLPKMSDSDSLFSYGHDHVKEDFEVDYYNTHHIYPDIGRLLQVYPVISFRNNLNEMVFLSAPNRSTATPKSLLRKDHASWRP